MMNKKIMFTILLAVLLGVGCGEKQQEETVSENAKRVIEAMFTCPNQELYSKDLQFTMEEYKSLTDAEKAHVQEMMEQSYESWEKAVGDCFGDGYLMSFVKAGPAVSYLMEAEHREITIEVLQMTVEEKTDVRENIVVTFSMDGEEEQETLEFRYDSEGLIKSVFILTENNESKISKTKDNEPKTSKAKQS